MSLGNWMQRAFDQDMKPAKGSFITPKGVKGFVYKNWISLYDPEYIGEFWDGRLIFKDLSVVAERGPQQGIYYAMWHGHPLNEDYRAEYGLGVYGWNADDGHDAWLGVLKESEQFLRDFLTRAASFDGYPYLPLTNRDEPFPWAK